MEEYKEVPCKCGFTYEKTPEEFEIYHMKMGTYLAKELPKKPVLRCKICKTISFLSKQAVIHVK